MTPKRTVQLYVIYVRPMYGHLKSNQGKAEWKFWPLTDVHGNAVAFGSKAAAAPTLYEARRMRGERNAYLQKVGPWS